jgi:hypothetical protein
VNGNIFNSKGVHVGIVMEGAVFGLQGQKLSDLKGSNIYNEWRPSRLLKKASP